MKNVSVISGVLTAFAGEAFAGIILEMDLSPEPKDNAFETVCRPITNPTLFDLALLTTNIHPIFMYHNLPDQVNVAGGLSTYGW